ncbi:MAG: recombinase family protein [Gammaproteobacteria bacterium]
MRVALYARVSTTRQAENDLSIPDQLRQMRDWCQTNGHLAVQEYIEPGASATDDKRPIFQQMMADALQKSPLFDAIIIHSFSRFFRDGIEFGSYERKLLKHGVKVISITQPTSDDAGGEMMRRIINLFDEHQSKENSKHTSRAMKENARQGFFNGSRPPFGYQAVTTDIPGSRGRKKKRLEINEAEAGIVRRMYDLYERGLDGRTLGVKEIAKHLTTAGLLMRGKPWTIQKVHKVLSDSLYRGDYYFNVIDSKQGKKRPPSEWVKTTIPAIIDAATFERVRATREHRAPGKTAPSVVTSPTLLTGLLKCGICGAGMTQVTGKSGKYKYYKCTQRQNRGNHACTSRNLPMDKLDEQVLNQLANKVFAPDRLRVLVVELRKRIRSSKDHYQARLNEVNRQIKHLEERQQRLLEAIETGTIALDEVTQRRAQQIKAAREALFMELAATRREYSLPAVEYIKPSQVETFGRVLREKLLAKDSDMAKRYLSLLVDEVVVKDDTATVRGSYDALASTLHVIQGGKVDQVPRFIPSWRARRDSNSRPPGS